MKDLFRCDRCRKTEQRKYLDYIQDIPNKWIKITEVDGSTCIETHYCPKCKEKIFNLIERRK